MFYTVKCVIFYFKYTNYPAKHTGELTALPGHFVVVVVVVIRPSGSVYSYEEADALKRR